MGNSEKTVSDLSVPLSPLLFRSLSAALMIMATNPRLPGSSGQYTIESHIHQGSMEVADQKKTKKKHMFFSSNINPGLLFYINILGTS